MPRTSSADKILDFASELFAEHGYAGTIMDDVAELAGVNKATIYYHFQDKEHLYEEVLVRHLEALVTEVIKSVSQEDDVLEKLKAYIVTFAKEKSSRKNLTSILMREVAGGGDKMPNRAKALMHKILMLVKSILDQGIEEDLFRPTDILTLHMMVIGSLSFYITSEPMRKMMVSSDAMIHEAFKNSNSEKVALDIYEMVKRAVLKNKGEK